MRHAARCLVLLPLAATGLLLAASPALAHPLGNFTINQYAGIVVAPESVTVTRVVDMAEVPTVQTRRAMDDDRDGLVSAAEADTFSAAECARLARDTDLRWDGRRVELRVLAEKFSLPVGQAGLPTLRLECELTATIDGVSDGDELHYEGDGYVGRLGWREVTAAGDGVTLVESDVPARSLSRTLTVYPQDLLSSPLETSSADLVLRPGGARLGTAGRVADSGGLLPRGLDRLSLRLTGLVSERDLTAGFALTALALAMGLGAMHAVSPGHGKTVMAAYLVGQRGTVRQAAVIGLTVTATHTIGVLALGIALTTSTQVAPERLIPWLGVASGLLLAVVGAFLLRRAYGALRAAHRSAAVRSVPDHAHDHDHEHPHPHPHPPATSVSDDGWHAHGGTRHQHAPLDRERPLHWRSLVALGFAGGLVPSPSALVVLLGAIALGRAWFGLVLVLGFGAGMAMTLMGAGLLLERGRRTLDRWAGRRGSSPRAFAVMRLMPVLTATVVVLVGLTLAGRGASVALS